MIKVMKESTKVSESLPIKEYNFNNTFITRRVDDLGRIVIPRTIRQELRIKEGDLLEIYVDKYSDIPGVMFTKAYADPYDSSPTNLDEALDDDKLTYLKTSSGDTSNSKSWTRSYDDKYFVKVLMLKKESKNISDITFGEQGTEGNISFYSNSATEGEIDKICDKLNSLNMLLGVDFMNRNNKFSRYKPFN